ncbi:HD domain-containing protein [Desulfoferula mesophila]|uniref:Phosphohydrolase n=1 Tax=Desulfoferula mesophila TaxID=3058419 RepID=A0AAU9EVP9_9BACT|nr:phosphohydrolase [Desulfoferula mesophilus]
MDYAAGLELLKSQVDDERIRMHSLASAVVLRALARRLGQDEETWALAGLLHDLDYGQTADQMHRHGLVTAELLADTDLPPEVVEAIKAHNAENLGLKRSTPLDLALTAGETITGLVMATTMVYPDKKLASVKPKSVTKRMKEKAFAASVNRDHIRLCEELGIPLPEFAALAVEAMREISDDLGL